MENSNDQQPELTNEQIEEHLRNVGRQNAANVLFAGSQTAENTEQLHAHARAACHMGAHMLAAYAFNRIFQNGVVVEKAFEEVSDLVRQELDFMLANKHMMKMVRPGDSLEDAIEKASDFQ